MDKNRRYLWISLICAALAISVLAIVVGNARDREKNQVISEMRQRLDDLDKKVEKLESKSD